MKPFVCPIIAHRLLFATALCLCLGMIKGCEHHADANQHDIDGKLVGLTSKARENMVFIQGGTFIMGDFGVVGDDGVWRPYFPATAEQNKAHEVILTSYSLSRHKTTWEDFDTYLLANNLPFVVHGLTKSWTRSPFDNDPESRLFIDKPAQVTWQEAKSYCQWLGTLTELPLDLPTSAQWEFAGRNRGSNAWLYSTHDGKRLQSHPELAQKVYEAGEYVPVGSRLPANPLGIYDMADNGKEWVYDWFSESWYRDNASITDPKGPDNGTQRTVRNLDFSFSRVGMSKSAPSLANEDWESIAEYTFRCALQQATPLEKTNP